MLHRLTATIASFAVITVVGVLIIVGGLTQVSLAVEEGWTVDVAGAKQSAVKSKKDLFLEFTGSDWCPPCKILKARIFDAGHFKAEAPKHFVLVKLDYPNDKSHQTAAEIAQNREMQKQYSISGFPTVILADAKGRPYAQWVGFGGESPEDYIKKIVEKKKTREARDVGFAKAAKAKGVEKAKALDEALRAIPSALLTSAYKAEVDQIMKLDADNAAGLKAKYQGIIQAPEIEKKIQQIVTGSANPAAAIASIDALIKERKLVGAALQEALFGKAIATYQGDDKKGAIVILKQAAQAAPKTEKAEMIANVIKQLMME